MDIEKNFDLQKVSPSKEEDSHQNEGNRITDKLSDINQIKGFQYQMRNSKSNEDKLNDINVLSKTPSHILYKFCTTPGFRILGEWVYELSDNVPENAEVLEKIFGFLKELQVNSQHLENAHYLGLGIEKMHIAQQNTEDSEGFNMFYKFYYLNKSTINEWLDSYKKRSQDPNFKKQYLWSEQNKYSNKKPNNNNVQYNNNRFPQNNYTQNKYNSNNNNNNNNFSKVNNKNGTSGNNHTRGDSPPTQKKLKQNDGNGQNRNSQRDINNGKKFVSFSVEDEIKRFRKEDEPIAPDMTDEEVELYKQECQKKKQQSIHVFFNTQDMRERENKLEKESRNQQLEQGKKERQKLDEMKADCNWRAPIKIKSQDSQFFQNLSSESFEKQLHEKRILCKMQSLYVSDNDIPYRPSYENVINDQISEVEPKQIYLNKLDEGDFIQVIEMAIKNDNNEQNKKTEKNVLKSILKISKEEKELQRKKMIEEKKKQSEEEERIKKQIKASTLIQLVDLIMNYKNNSKEDIIQGVKDLGLSEKELHCLYQNINIIKTVQQQRSKEIQRASLQATEEKKEQQNPNQNQQNSNQYGNRQDNNSNFQNNQTQLNQYNNVPTNGIQNNSFNQYNGNQMNSQQNYQNKYQNGFNNNNQNPQPNENNYNNQNRFNNNGGLNKNNQTFIPNQNNQQQNTQFANNEQKQFQNFSQNQPILQQHNQQQQNNFNNQQQNSFNNNNNRNFQPRQNIAMPPPSQANSNNNQMNQFNQPQNNQVNSFQQKNFNSNQNQQAQAFQPQKPLNNNNSFNGNQIKPFSQFQNQQNNVPKFNQNQPNQNFQNGQQNHQMSQNPVQKQQGEENKSVPTVPCRLYHSEAGCKREVCTFLHIQEYQGRAAPFVHKQQRVESSQAPQLNSIPFPISTLTIPPPPPPPQPNNQKNNQNYQPYNSFKPQPPSFQQQQFNQQRDVFSQPPPQQSNSNMFLMQKTNPLLKQQFKAQPIV